MIAVQYTKFSKAAAPARAPYLRPAGKAEIDYFGLKLIVHVLIRGCSSIRHSTTMCT